MQYMNYNDIKGFSDKSDKTATMLVAEAYLEKKASWETFDIFLSHSSKDADHLPGIIAFLKKYGMNVYIDKTDKELPQKTSPETGARLKEMIGQSRKFILLVTPNSKESKWVPWELGIGDIKKTLRNVAVLPAAQNSFDTNWAEQEYIGLYSRVVWNTFKGKSSPEWMVLDHHNNSATSLREWLKR